MAEKEGPKQAAEEKFEHPPEYWKAQWRQAHEKLERERRRVKELEQSEERLKQENERLRQELDLLSRPTLPVWVKPNLSLQPGRRPRKKPGPQPGHRAAHRLMPEESRIDREVKLAPSHCPKCQAGLPSPSSWHSHVQWELPEAPRLEVTRYWIGWSFCRLCQSVHGPSSEQRKQAGLLPQSKYGPRLHAQVAYWKFGLGLTLGKIQKQLKDQYALPISTGQLSEMLQNTARRLEPCYEDLTCLLRAQDHVYADETGWRESGDNRWLWSFSNEQVSVYRIEKSRGRKVVRASLGRSWKGVLVSDFYSAYNEADCPKQKCWTHLLRETRELKQSFPKDSEIRRFHQRLKSLFRRGVRLQGRSRRGEAVEISLRHLQEQTWAYLSEPQTHPDLVRLAKRMHKHRDALYTFVEAPVDPTNNRAEQEIRPAVLMRKTSYTNRSARGAHTQEILLSLIRTCSKRQLNFVETASRFLLAFPQNP